MTKNDVAKLIVIVLLGIAAFCLYNYQQKKRNDLKNHFELTVGYPYEKYAATNSYKLGLRYYYFVNGRRYEGTDSYLKHGFAQGELFIGKSFPVAYSEINPDNSDMLIDREDFTKYNLSYPDSLSWVEHHRY